MKSIFSVEKLHIFFFGTSMSKMMKSFLKDLNFVFFGVGLASLVSFVLGLVGARFLGVTEFGKYQLLFAVAQILNVFFLSGLHFSGAKYISEFSDIEKKERTTGDVIFLFVIVTIICSIVLFFFRIDLAQLFDIDLVLFEQAIILAWIISIFTLIRSIAQGWKKLKGIAIMEATSMIVTLLIFVAYVYFLQKSIGYIYYYYAIIFGYLFFIFGMVYILYNILQHITCNVKKSGKIIRYAYYILLGGISGILLSTASRVMLNYYYDSATVGLYAAYSMVSIGLFGQLINIFVTAFVPYVSGAEDKVAVAKKLNVVSGIGSLSSFFLSILILFGSLLVMGSEYEIRLDFIVLFSLCAAITVAYQVKMWYLNAHGLGGLKKVVKGTVLGGVGNVAIMFFLIPVSGINGVLWATIISSIFLYVYFSWVIRKEYL